MYVAWWSWVWHKTASCGKASALGVLRFWGAWSHPSVVAAPRSTLARSGSTCQGPIYGSNRNHFVTAVDIDHLCKLCKGLAATVMASVCCLPYLHVVDHSKVDMEKRVDSWQSSKGIFSLWFLGSRCSLLPPSMHIRVFFNKSSAKWSAHNVDIGFKVWFSQTFFAVFTKSWNNDTRSPRLTRRNWIIPSGLQF